MPTENFFFWVSDSITKLVTQYGGVFQQTGSEWLRAISVVMLVILGLRIAASALGGQPGDMGFGAVARYAVLVVFCLMMLRYYDTPIPGAGVSFTGAITGMGAHLANQIDTTMTERLIAKFSDVILAMEGPAWYDVLGSITSHLHYYFCVFALLAIQCIMLGVISFGWVALGILKLLGPLFIPFLIVPKIEERFWGWFWALVQYSFYPVVANAFVFVYGQVILNFFSVYQGPYTAEKIAGMFLTLVALALALVFGFFKIPGLVADMFRGTSGQHTMPGMGWWRG
jgi:hypothetical protein